MKKSLKKLFALAICAMLVLGMMTTAFADETTTTYTITITSSISGHTYEAYQVFSGDYVDGTLSDIEWGSGVDGAAILAELDAGYSSAEDVAAALVGGETLTAANFAKIVAKHLTTTCTESSAVAGGYTISNLTAGYYLVKDKDNTLSGGNAAYTSYILQLVKNVTVTPKAAIPTLVKKVEDKKDSTGDSAWYDSADHDIGDAVAFKLTATLPNNVSSYTTYKVVFHDTLSKGLTFDPDSVTVKIGDTVVTSSFTVVPSTYSETDGTTITFTCNDVKALGATDNSVITVQYNATLNDKAVIGAAGNPNTAYLEYSNNPNYTGEGKDSPTGKTPEDKVIVFTYQLDVNKVDEEGKPLAGAQFTLYKWYNSKTADTNGEKWEQVQAYTGGTETTFTFKGLDDGRYKLEETASPAGYNTLSEPIYFTISASHKQSSDNPTLDTLTVNQTNAAGDDFENGVAVVFAVDKTTGEISTNVENKTGLTLPSTGGIGTTLFYVVGGLMMAGAAVLLITKKRMNGCEG